MLKISLWLVISLHFVPETALNPLMSMGKQIEENLDYHATLSTKKKKVRVLELDNRMDLAIVLTERSGWRQL